MKSRQRVITDNTSLRAHYDELREGDICVGRIRLRASEEHLLLDLSERGVLFIPSALSQLASRLKTMQALLFSRYMVPGTRAVHDLHDLLDVMNQYRAQGLDSAVTKQDRSNAGLGIHFWSSLEDVYNQASFKQLPFPFVMQPYYKNCRDIRVIVLGEYEEAYWRHNPYNFRNNLSLGGESKEAAINEEQRMLCREVMARGKFPYAHIDLLVTPAGDAYLSEINLRGGLKGAKIEAEEYRSRVEQIHQHELQKALDERE